MTINKPVFGRLGENTVTALILSVLLTTFLSTCVAIFFIALVSAGFSLENLLIALVAGLGYGLLFGSIGALFYGTIIVIPVLLIGIPLYKLLVVRFEVTLLNCIIASLFVYNVCALIMVFMDSAIGQILELELFLLFNLPTFLAAVIFHRMDQGKWW